VKKLGFTITIATTVTTTLPTARSVVIIAFPHNLTGGSCSHG
jgi:hypothetical protein